MKYLVILSLLLSGCASNCTHACLFGFGPGNSAFETVANYHDTMDVCQHKGKPDGYVLPNYCSINAGKRVYYVRDVNNRVVYKVQ